MKLEILMLNEVSQKDKYHIMITYIWNGIYSTNEPIYRKETNLWTWSTDLCLPRQKGRSGMVWESEFNRCKLLPLEWISNEILLYSTRNYI